MDNITASIIVACQTQGAAAAIDKLGFSLGMLGKKAFDFGVQAVKEFQSTQDAAWKFNRVFSDSMGSAENAVRDFKEQYNLADSTARTMLTDTAGLLQGMGFDDKKSLEMSKTISKWGVDLASFTGYAGGAKGAADAIVESLMGENEKLKGLRIVIREDSEEFRNMTREMMTTQNVSEEHAKVLAKLQLITQKAAKAKNDYIAPGENFTQSVNNLNQHVKQMTSDIGQVIYEGLRLNDVFSWLGNGAKTITKWWSKEGETWILLIRKFVNNLVAGVKIAALPFSFLWENMKQGFTNIINLGGWFNTNWGKIWGNSLEIIKAVFLDIWEYIKWFWGPNGIIAGFFVKAGEALWDAIKIGIKGGNAGQVFADAFSSYLNENIIRGFAKQGRNLEKALVKAGIKAPEFKGVSFRFSEKYGEIMDELNRQQQREIMRFEERTKAKQDKNKGGGANAAAIVAPAITADIAKAIFKYRTTAQSAIDANSAEGWRLQSRRIATNAGTDPQLSAATSLKHLEQQITDTNAKLEEMKRELRALTSGGAKITVATRKY